MITSVRASGKLFFTNNGTKLYFYIFGNGSVQKIYGDDQYALEVIDNYNYKFRHISNTTHYIFIIPFNYTDKITISKIV